MPLNSSGPISIGGSTTGQSINLQLGRSATAQSSLGESALRNLAGVASGQISLSNFYGKPVSCLPYGTLVSTECLNAGVSPYTLRAYYANGTCGTYYSDFNNAQECGAPCDPYGTFLYYTCGVNTRVSWCADGSCGAYQCNYESCTTSGTPVGGFCTSPTGYVTLAADGCCGTYQSGYGDCSPNVCSGGQCCQPAGTLISGPYCDGNGNPVKQVANGSCATYVESAPECYCNEFNNIIC